MSYHCGVCGKSASLVCSKCNIVTYCGVDHQRVHWSAHKLVCRPLPQAVLPSSQEPEIAKAMGVQLYEAIISNKTADAIQLLRDGADLYGRYMTFASALEAAITYENTDVALAILSIPKVHIDLHSSHRSCLLLACDFGMTSVIARLLDLEQDVNQVVGKSTPLIAAVIANHLDVVNLLLDKGADVNQISSSKSALRFACENKVPLISLRLIEAGATVDDAIEKLLDAPVLAEANAARRRRTGGFRRTLRKARKQRQRSRSIRKR